MKNTTYFYIALLLVSITTHAQSGIPTKATFGRHSNCSTGRGACSFTLSKSETGTYSRKTAANTVTLEINNNTLKGEDQIKIAGKYFTTIKEGEMLVFVQQETIILDSISIEYLNLDHRYNRIIPGNYAMKITKDKTEIVFELKNAD